MGPTGSPETSVSKPLYAKLTTHKKEEFISNASEALDYRSLMKAFSGLSLFTATLKKAAANSYCNILKRLE
jgi:hypothetical protein